MMEWNNDDDSFSNGGFGGRAGGALFGGPGGAGGAFRSNWATSKAIGGAVSSKKPGGDSHGWAKNVNKMINIHNIPFFGHGQTFLGKTIWDWVRRPKASFCDSIDRINCSWTPALLLFFAAVITANILGFNHNEPMRCLKSPELTEEERDYALDICNTKNTYYVAPDEGIPWPNHERRRREIGYYHWIPVTLFLQAILFFLPNRLWNSLNRQSGVDFVELITESGQLREAPPENNPTQNDEIADHMAGRMYEALLDRVPKRLHGCRFGRTLGCYVTGLYVFVKMLYLLNVAGQFFLLNAFVGRSYKLWGLEVLRALLYGENWQDSPVFPRLTLCDVPIRRLGDVPRYTLQCHLRINTYNEKIYLFIWWFILALSIATFFNLIYYLFVLLLFPWTRERTVRYLLKHHEFHHIVTSTEKKWRRLVKRFANDNLRYDGVLLFWFIEGHAGPMVARALMARLFQLYLNEKRAEADAAIANGANDENRTNNPQGVTIVGGRLQQKRAAGNGASIDRNGAKKKSVNPSFSSQSTGSLTDELLQDTDEVVSTPKRVSAPPLPQQHMSGATDTDVSFIPPTKYVTGINNGTGGGNTGAQYSFLPTMDDMDSGVGGMYYNAKHRRNKQPLLVRFVRRLVGDFLNNGALHSGGLDSDYNTPLTARRQHRIKHV